MKPNRSGFSLIAVLALLSLAGSLFVVWTRQSLQLSQQTRLSHQRVQAEWLAASALKLIAEQWAADASYRGEPWTLSPDELGQAYAASIEVAVAERNDATWATVTVTSPPGDNARVRCTQQIKLNQPPKGANP